MGAPLSTTSPITFRSSQSLVSDHTSCELYLLSSGCELLPRQIHLRTSKGSENGASSSSLIQRETVNDPFNLLTFYNEWRWMTKCLWCCDRDKTLNQRVYRKTLRNPSNCVNNCLILWFLYFSLFCCSLILLLFIFFMTQSLINVSTVTTTSLVTYLAVIDIHLKPNHVHNTCNEWVQRDASEMTGPPGLPTGGSPVSSPSPCWVPCLCSYLLRKKRYMEIFVKQIALFVPNYGSQTFMQMKNRKQQRQQQKTK